jgi:hypothetical protein
MAVLAVVLMFLSPDNAADTSVAKMEPKKKDDGSNLPFFRDGDTIAREEPEDGDRRE